MRPRVHDPSRLRSVPSEFAEEAKEAAAKADVPHLALLAAEAEGFSWEMEAWRNVGQALFDLGAWGAAGRTWERVRRIDPADVRANAQLGAILHERDERAAHAVREPCVVVFAGHRVDEPARATPRFPEACVEAARTEIRKRLQALKPTIGLAGAASGGDLLFHQVCGELEIPSGVRLVMPERSFMAHSVASAGQRWIDEYWALIDAKRSHQRLRVLSRSEELPGWLERKADYSVWQRANLWLLEEALALEPDRLSVLALWNGDRGDGPGGTDDLLERAKALGATLAVIDTKKVCGL
jgi:hypothetical protein